MEPFQRPPLRIAGQEVLEGAERHEDEGEPPVEPQRRHVLVKQRQAASRRAGQHLGLAPGHREHALGAIDAGDVDLELQLALVLVIDLREAILIANGTLLRSDLTDFEKLQVGVGVGSGNQDTIGFNISGAGVHTFTPLSGYAALTDSAGTIIDGYTQSGSSPNTNPTGALNTVLTVEISGTNLPGSTTVLWLNSDNNTVKGLILHGATSNVIGVTNNRNNTKIQGNFIGVNSSGTAAISSTFNGVWGEGSTNLIVGTDGDGVDDIAERNLISGNGTNGVYLSDNANGNRVSGNLIGTDITGTVDLGNASYGVFIENTSNNNIIGTNGDGVSDIIERNVLSGNNLSGVSMNNSSTGNRIAGNYMGTNAAGTAALGNSVYGVRIANGSNNNIVGTNSDGNNDAIEGMLGGFIVELEDENSTNVRIGGATAPYLSFYMPAVQFSFPTHQIDDVIAVSFDYKAVEATADCGNGGEIALFVDNA